MTSEHTKLKEGTVKDYYYRYKDRIERINEVSELLSEQRINEDQDRAIEIWKRLQEIYSTKLD